MKALFQDLVPGRVVLRDAVSFREGLERFRVLVHLGKEFRAEFFGGRIQFFDAVFDVSILLLADGEASDHVAEGNGQSTCQRGSAAAARCGGSGGELC